MQPSNSRRGFTLIELVVTLTIMSVITAATLVTVRRSSTLQEFDRGSRQLEVGLVQAHSLALGPAVDKTPGSDGYRFDLLQGKTAGQFTDFQIRELDVLNPDGTVKMPGRVVSQDHLHANLYVSLPQANPVTSISFSISQFGDITSPQPADGQVTWFLINPSVSNQKYQLTLSTVTGQLTSSPISM